MRALVLLVASLAVAVAGCGNKTASPPGIAQLTSSATTTTSHSTGSAPLSRQSKLNSRWEVRFSACMRSHGVPSFPDPQPVAGGGMRLTIDRRHGVDPSTPQFKAAQRACERLLPAGKGGDSTRDAATQARLLKFATCMRSHGLPDFPDPQVSGGDIKIEGGKSRKLDPDSPVFQAAERACKHLLPGGGPGVAP